MVDNFAANRRLGLMFEASVGKRSLFFNSIGLLIDSNTDPLSTQLLMSVLEYMKSDEFSPAGNITKVLLNGLGRLP